mgnify:CR=1 FL=1
MRNSGMGCFASAVVTKGSASAVPSSISINPSRAASFALELRQKTNLLEKFPGMGRAGRVHGTRELVLHKNYLAIYRVKGGDVEILRIHHVAKQL